MDRGRARPLGAGGVPRRAAPREGRHRRRERARAPAGGGRGASSARGPRSPGRPARSRPSPSRRRGRTRRPRSRTCSRGHGCGPQCPATSFPSSHGWLNHVALISPVSSATRAVRIFSRPRRRLVDRADHALEHRLLVTEEIADPLRRHRLLVAPRTLPEQISDRGEPEPREATCQRRADAVQRLHRRAEKLRPRRGPRSRPPLGRVEAGEAAASAVRAIVPI